MKNVTTNNLNTARNKNFTLRLNQSEYEYLKSEADAKHIAVAAYIRQIVLEGMNYEKN